MTHPPASAHYRCGGLLALWLLAACACDTPGAAPTAESRRSAGASETLARVDGQPISAENVDAALQIDLHDLALARYRLRAERLEGLVAQRLEASPLPAKEESRQRVEILLAAPEAPRMEIPIRGARLRGAEAAPVTLVEFIDFQSSQARRLQPLLERVLDAYPGEVRLAVRDLALPFHRYAQRAAEAAHCAGDQDAYWAYHDTLLLEQPDLSPEDLKKYAERLRLDSKRFQRCLDEAHHAPQVRSDGMLAARLGVKRAPTVFVNGLYLAPPVRHETLVRVIDTELGHPPGGSAQESPVGPASPPPSRADVPQGSAATRPPLPEVPLDQLPAPEAVLDIPRAEVERALALRTQLEEELELSTGTFSGRRLVKLRDVESGDLYDRFGLERGDVLMLVDDQWITDEGNPLWQALERRDEITLLVMRKGRPHRYRYRIR